MSFDYASLITDRTVSDSNTLKALLGKPMAEWTAEELAAFNGAVLKGSYNYTDLNRVDACLEDLVARLGRLGYSVPGYERVKIERTVTPSSRLPEGYTELAYIQSTGTQWINTGFKPTGNTKIICDFLAYDQSTSQQGVFGSRPGTSGRFTLFTGHSTKALQADYDTAQTLGNEDSTISGLELTSRTVISMSNELLVDGITVKSVAAASFSSTYDLYLFANNNIGTVQLPAKLKLYACQIYDGGQAVRDFVPAQNEAGAVGLYDLVDGKFYGNSGTGVFYAGPQKVTLPDGFTQLESIGSTGTQYINTEFKPKNTTKIAADFQVTTQPTSHLIIFGSRTSYSSSDQFVLGFAGHKSPAVWRADFGSGQTSFPSTAVWSSRYTAVFDDSACVLNADSVAVSASAFTSTHNLFLWADNDNETAAGYISATLYACRIYDNGTLTRNFIPCKNASGAVGLYDTVGAEFYPNAGTGSFTAGAAVTWAEDPDEPSAELDPYIWYESDVPTAPLMARYRANVAAVRGALALPEGTPGVPETMRRLTPAAANSIEAVLLALDIILTNLPAAVRHCGVSTCGSKGVIA